MTEPLPPTWETCIKILIPPFAWPSSACSGHLQSDQQILGHPYSLISSLLCLYLSLELSQNKQVKQKIFKSTYINIHQNSQLQKNKFNRQIEKNSCSLFCINSFQCAIINQTDILCCTFKKSRMFNSNMSLLMKKKSLMPFSHNIYFL